MTGQLPLASGKSMASKGNTTITHRRRVRQLNILLATHDQDRCYGILRQPTCKAIFSAHLLPPSPAPSFYGSVPMQLSLGTSGTYDSSGLLLSPVPQSVPVRDTVAQSATRPLPPWMNPALRVAPGGGSQPIHPLNTIRIESGSPCRMSDASDFDPEVASSSILGDWKPTSGKTNDFDKHWLKVKHLGEGCSGYVCLAVRKITSSHYKAEDAGKIYAVKRMLRPQVGNSSHNSIHWERYAHALCKQSKSWQSMNLFAWMEDGEKNVRYPTWCAFNYIQGPTLHEMHGFFDYSPAPLVLDILEDLCEATGWLHAEVDGKPRMAHADLHTSNVMLDLSRPVPEGRHPHIRILDFGMTQWAGPTDTRVQHQTVTRLQHRDIDFIGGIIHRLVCRDPRYLGFHNGYLANQVTHCHSCNEAGLETYCPRLTDPYSALFMRHDNPLWDFIIRGMFMKNDSVYCDEIKDWTMDTVNAYLQPMIAEARAHEMGMPHFKMVYDYTMSVLQSAIVPPPLLPPEYRSSPPPPPPIEEMPSPPSYPPPSSTSSCTDSDHYSPPPAGHQAVCYQEGSNNSEDDLPDYEYYEAMEQRLWEAQKQAPPQIPCKAPARHNPWWPGKMRASHSRVGETHVGKRTRLQMDVDENPGIDGPLAKRIRSGLAWEIARLGVLDRSHDPYGISTQVDMGFGGQNVIWGYELDDAKYATTYRDAQLHVNENTDEFGRTLPRVHRSWLASVRIGLSEAVEIELE